MASHDGKNASSPKPHLSTMSGDSRSNTALCSKLLPQAIYAVQHASSPFTQEGSSGAEAVVAWLETLGLSYYIPMFRAQNITPLTLLSLDADELRITLGVVKFKDRRLMLTSIHKLQQEITANSCPALPEDGRILTHLMAERVLLGWASVSLNLQMLAMATARLVKTKNKADAAFVVPSVCVLEALAFSVLCSAIYQHFWMERVMRKIDHDPFHKHIPKLYPVMLVVSGTVIVFYTIIFSNYVEDGGAIMMMLCV